MKEVTILKIMVTLHDCQSSQLDILLSKVYLKRHTDGSRWQLSGFIGIKYMERRGVVFNKIGHLQQLWKSATEIFTGFHVILNTCFVI